MTAISVFVTVPPLLAMVWKICYKGTSKNVIPTKVGIQNLLKLLDSGFRRNDK